MFIYILENDGSCLSAAINAAGLALADAAVPMYDVITSCSVAVVGDRMFVDPTEAEENFALISPDTPTNHGVVTLSMLSELKQVSDFTQVGSMNIECIGKVSEILEKECARLVPMMQKVLVANVLKCFEQWKRKQTKESSF